MANETTNYQFKLPLVDGSDDIWGDLLNQNWSDIDILLKAVDDAQAAHASRIDNPHNVTKAQVGLGNVDNVSAANLRDRSSHTGTQTLATISDAGTAAAADLTTSDTNAIVGRVMRVGDFGVGQASLIDGFDLSAADISGLRYTGFLNGLNTPNWLNAARGFLLHLGAQGTSNSPELLFQLGSSLYELGYRPNKTAEFSRIYNERTILGTVSQSAGVPTGAIIERGSNANGEYVKFADGTMICTHAITFTNVAEFGDGTRTNPYRSDVENWIFPVIFSSAPNVTCSASVNLVDSPARMVFGLYRSVGASATYNVQVLRVSDSPTVATADVDCFAIGRWF